MEQADDSQQFDEGSSNREHNPSLLTVILDTNPAAWALISDTLSLANVVADLLVFINAHLACNYTNQVAVIASHCDQATWLYPSPKKQQPRSHHKAASQSAGRSAAVVDGNDAHTSAGRNKRARTNGAETDGHNGSTTTSQDSNKYRPFRLIEEELFRNLTNLLSSTLPETIQAKTSTMIAGALTLALNHINRRSSEYAESISGAPSNLADASTNQATINPDSENDAGTRILESRILLVTLSPSTDLAHQYIPIMNSIFACQRLGIPIDVLQLPLPQSTTTSNQNSTVFLQQASDATHGIFIPARLGRPSRPKADTAGPEPSTSLSSSASTSAMSVLTYLLTAFLPSPQSRTHLILPTRIDVDFRAACFCHRNVISTGFVCSICLSIFCGESPVLTTGECLTCGTRLALSDYGTKPIVVARKKKKKKRVTDAVHGSGGAGDSGTASPVR